MEKLVLKGKKEVRNLLADSLHQTINTLGIAQSNKKVEAQLEKSAKKLAAVVGKQLKKDLKKMSKLRKKTVRKKEKELVSA